MPQSSHWRVHSPANQQHRRTRTGTHTVAGVAFFATLLAFTLLGATSAFAITRDTVLARAQTWVDSPVRYSQSAYFGGYRTDCSGYASMCWQTGTSWNTRTFYRVSHPIRVDELKPGDAMLAAGNHIRIFYGWADAEHTRYVAYEQTGPTTKSSIKSLASDLGYGYIPYRYNLIEDSPAPRNALKNGSFDVWASGDPVWWAAVQGHEETLTVRNKDVFRTARNSLELLNPSGDKRVFTEFVQTVDVVPATAYTLSAWARTSCDPSGLELRLDYLDAAGQALVTTRTAGAAWGIGSAQFMPMTLSLATPAQAAKAVVRLRLAGGSTVATTAPGTSVTLDDVSLARPQADISIRTTSASVVSRSVPILSGWVTPTSAIGTNIVVYVKKPGRAYYSYSSNRTVYLRSGAAAWQYKYYFKPGMAKGLYYFKASVPDLPGYLGSTSGVISVRLR